jgi:hypothetical protein
MTMWSDDQEQPQEEKERMRYCGHCGAAMGRMTDSKYHKVLNRRRSRCKTCWYHPKRRSPMDWYVSCGGNFAEPKGRRLQDVIFLPDSIPCMGDGYDLDRLRMVHWSLWQESANRPRLHNHARSFWEAHRTMPDDWEALRSDREETDWIKPEADLPQEHSDRTEQQDDSAISPTKHDDSLMPVEGSSCKPSITLSRPSQPIAAYLEKTEPIPKKVEPSRRTPSDRGATSVGSPLTMSFICLEVRSKWMPCIRVDSTSKDLTVSQGHEPLHQVARGCFEIRDLFTPVQATLNNNVQTIPLLDKAQDHMVFRMSQDWRGAGRVCRNITPGHYVVFASDSWSRDTDAAGAAPIEAESASISGYQVHFFHIEEGSNLLIRFLSDEGAPIDAYSSSFFYLEGNEQRKVARHDPPLYLGEFPNIHPVAGREWDEISRIEISSFNRDGWKLCIDPDNRDENGLLCFAERIRQSGQYQIKAICAETQSIVDSKTIRFFAPIQSIEVEGATTLPGQDGHNPATIIFHTSDPVQISAADSPLQECVPSGDDRVCVTIPPIHQNDLSQWRIKDLHYETALAVLIPRIWWALCREKTELSDPNWTSEPLSLPKSAFDAISQISLLMLAPGSDELDIEGVGLSWRGRRKVALLPGQSIRALQLRSFYDAAALQNHDGEKSLRLFVRENGKSRSIEIANIHVTLRCRECRQIVTKEDRRIHSLSHLEDLAPKLSYAEVRQLINTSWPEEIIRCAHCGHYIAVANGRYSAAEMFSHIKKDCEKAPRGGPLAQMSIRVVTDIDEIRESVLAELPLFWKCSLCGRMFDESERNVRADHLVESHLEELYNVE